MHNQNMKSLKLILSFVILHQWYISTVSASSIPQDQIERVLTLSNQAIAQMDRYLPSEAAATFAEVVKLVPDWTPGRLNWAIALLNTNIDDNLIQAERELNTVLEHEPDNPHAHYCLGLILKNRYDIHQAKLHFQKVLEFDPGDLESHLQLGDLMADDDPQTAKQHLEKVLEKSPNNETAIYRLSAIYRKLGDKEKSQELLKEFQRLKTTQSGETLGTVYGEMGKYAEIIRSFKEFQFLDTSPQMNLTFTERAESLHMKPVIDGRSGRPGESLPNSAEEIAQTFGPGVAVADVDNDGDLDVFIPNIGADRRGILFLYENDCFTEVPQSGIDGHLAIGAYFADYDKDGAVDLFLTCAGPNRLYRNNGHAAFLDVSQQCGLNAGNFVSLGAVWGDLDCDGDLDLYVANYATLSADSAPTLGAPNEFWRNNGDGTFTNLAREAGIDGGHAATVSAAFFDADEDRDLDAFIINNNAPNQLYINQRIGRYQEAIAQYPALNDSGPGTGCLLGDVNRDGREDVLILRGPESPRLLLKTGRTEFVEDAHFKSLADSLGGATTGAFADFDLDGDLDLALCGVGDSNRSAQLILLNDGSGQFTQTMPLGEKRPLQDTRGVAAADFNQDGSPEILIVHAKATPELWQATPPAGFHWLTVQPIEPQNENQPGNVPSTIGTFVEIKSGPLLQVKAIGTSAGYLGGPPAQAHFGLGRSGKADYVRLIWPDGVLQSEMEVPADRNWPITKVIRKPSSCPILFCWDGKRFAFVTDFLGVGGIGFFIQPGVYAPPDPSEAVRIPPETIQPKEGRYLLRITEPLEEISYIDELKLKVYDHPATCEIYPDERFSGLPPFATGEPLMIERDNKLYPFAARNDRGDDLLEALRTIDRRYAEPPLDSRFIGYAHDHWIELDFGNQLANRDPQRRITLFAYGWVEYTYSHVNYAAWQARLSMQSPSIEIPDETGDWKTVIPDIGFPAGLPRMMTCDISALPLQYDGRFRIHTNMEIYWDQIFIAETLPDAQIQTTILSPLIAKLRPLGYPREYSPDGSFPTIYDYHLLDRGIPFKFLSGDLTRFGDIRELLESTDDRYVIMGRGEEIALEFNATQLPALPHGWSRTLVLHAMGYCKDMDLYTAYPDTIEPLPFQTMVNYPPQQPFPDTPILSAYRKQWNTRRLSE